MAKEKVLKRKVDARFRVESLSVHEIAHAAAAIALGDPVRVARVRDGFFATHGRVRHVHDESPGPEVESMTLWAAPIAEARFLEEVGGFSPLEAERQAELNAAVDLSKIAVHLADHGQREKDRIFGDTVVLVDSLWGGIRVLGTRLAKEKRLSGRVIARGLGLSNKRRRR